MNYITDSIGDEYEKWEEGQMIFIKAPTGSGKTFFILHRLLNYAVKNQRRMLYLVNRAILKKQIMADIETLRSQLFTINKNINLHDWLCVMTYQELEERCKANLNYYNCVSGYFYVVADECHYFMLDSMFNSNTQISYDWIVQQRNYGSIAIFMSATIENIKDYVIGQATSHRLQFLAVDNLDQKEKILRNNNQIKVYDQLEVRNNVKVVIFDKIENIFDIIKNSDDKWLIFVNNISRGKEIEDELRDAEIDAKFIYAGDETGEDTVDGIARKQQFTQKVLIATSVLDNGVSIKDEFLRNLIIMTDTREDLLQMYGRKRKLYEGEKITLYLCKQSALHFQKRLGVIQQYENQINWYFSLLSKLQLSMDKLNWYTPELTCYLYNKYIDSKQLETLPKIEQYQMFILHRIMGNHKFDEYKKKFLFQVGVVLYPNCFSITQIGLLKNFYLEMIEKMRKDEMAFVRMQAEWLDIDLNNEDIIEYLIRKEEEYIGQIQDVLKQEVGKEYGTEEFRALKDTIRISIKELLIMKECSRKEIIATFNKNKQPVSIEKFNATMEFLNLEYRLVKPNRSLFKIVSLEDYEKVTK